MNAVVKPQNTPPAGRTSVVATESPLDGCGELYTLSGESPSTAERLAALRQALADTDGRKHRAVVLNWDYKTPFGDDFVAPALQVFEELAARGHRVALTSQRTGDERVLETLAIECIVTGLNVQYFREVARARLWARYL